MGRRSSQKGLNGRGVGRGMVAETGLYGKLAEERPGNVLIAAVIFRIHGVFPLCCQMHELGFGQALALVIRRSSGERRAWQHFGRKVSQLNQLVHVHSHWPVDCIPALCVSGQRADLIKRRLGELQQDIGYLTVEEGEFLDIRIQERSISPFISRGS